MNLRPSGYEPDELPGCSTPRYFNCLFITNRPEAVNGKNPLRHNILIIFWFLVNYPSVFGDAISPAAAKSFARWGKARKIRAAPAARAKRVRETPH